jgi:hypothetical protein
MENPRRLHGDARGSGAARDEANGRYSHGLFTAAAIEERKEFPQVVERSAKRRWTLRSIERVPAEVVEERLRLGRA